MVKISMQKLPECSIQNTEANNKIVAFLWIQLAEIYGTKFITQFGARHSLAWEEVLSDLSIQDIGLGLKNLTTEERFESWPPTALEFRNLCLKRKKISIPDVNKIYMEAKNLANGYGSEHSHPLSKTLAKEMLTMFRGYFHEGMIFQKFCELYEQKVNGLEKGASLPIIEMNVFELKKASLEAFYAAKKKRKL